MFFVVHVSEEYSDLNEINTRQTEEVYYKEIGHFNQPRAQETAVSPNYENNYPRAGETHVSPDYENQAFGSSPPIYANQTNDYEHPIDRSH